MAAITVRNLTKRFEGGVVAVNGIDFAISDGELITLLGPSGCGKTTTLRLIAGLEVPDDGDILFGDRTVASVDRGVFLPPEQRDAGMVFQSYAIWPHMTVYENVSYPLRIRGVARNQTRERVRQALALLGLTELEERPATKLSGGQQQRVAIARALVSQPRLLLLDEPLANLDAKLRYQMRVELRELQRRLGITTIYVTHDQTEAMVLSDRILVMKDGNVQQVGPPSQVYRRPTNHFVADFVGFTNFLPGSVLEVEGDSAVVRLGEDGPVIRCRCHGGSKGTQLSVAMRATALAPLPPKDWGPNDLKGIVASTVYLGDVLECFVDAGPWRLTCAIPSEHESGNSYVPGQEICLRIDSDKAVALLG